jgi:hypothetical protein
MEEFMDCENTNWKEYDGIYYPKRKVNNHASWKIHHMIGVFYSNKMETAVEYESFGELLAYFLFDIDKLVLRYYVQPIKVDIPTFKENGEKTTWSHIPDVLVFRNGSNPILYQIKDPECDPPKNFELINEKCLKYANERNWVYKVIYPKLMPKVVCSNIELISSRTKKRNYYDNWIPEVIYRLKVENVISIMDLALSFKTRINPVMILPIIYYLISKGILKVDMFQVVNQYSKVTINNGQNDFDKFFSEEVSK